MRLELDQAGFLYQPGTPFESAALAGVSLVVEQGERIGVTGPVGSGKSTLLELLAGLRPPTQGRVIHDGRVLGGKGRRRRAKNGPEPGRIGLAFQSPEICLFEKTVIADVAYGPGNLGLDGDTARRRAEEALLAMGLDPAHFAGRSPWSLSSGEQRRVALAGVMAMQPEVLLLDEPTASLDPVTRNDLIGRLLMINEETGATIIVVSHDMDEMARFAQRLLILENGSLTADGPAGELLTDAPLLERRGLEASATVRLGGLLSEATGADVPALLTEAQAARFMLGMMGR